MVERFLSLGMLNGIPEGRGTLGVLLNHLVRAGLDEVGAQKLQERKATYFSKARKTLSTTSLTTTFFIKSCKN